MRGLIPAKERMTVTLTYVDYVNIVYKCQSLFRISYIELRHESHNMNKYLPFVPGKNTETRKPLTSLSVILLDEDELECNICTNLMQIMAERNIISWKKGLHDIVI
jgi:hypothetical protein